MCRIHAEVEVAKVAMRIGHLMLCGFSQHCSLTAARLVSSSLSLADTAPQEQRDQQTQPPTSATARREAAEGSPAADDTASFSTDAGAMPDAGLAGLHHLTAVRLLGEAASHSPDVLAAAVWDVLWPCLGSAGESLNAGGNPMRTINCQIARSWC